MGSRIPLFALLLLCSSAWSAEITIDAGRYTGFYGIGDSVYSGNVTLNLKPGIYKIWIGTTDGITLIASENSTFQLGDNDYGRASKIDDDQIRFITYPLTIEPTKTWKEWKIQRVTPPTNVRATTYLVPGSGYVLWFYKPQKLRKYLLNLDTDGETHHWSSAIIDVKEKWQSIPDSLVDSDPAERPTPRPKSLIAKVKDFVAIVRYTNPVGFFIGIIFAIVLGLNLLASIVIRHLKIDAAISHKKEKQESEQQNNKILEIGAIIVRSFLLAAGTFMLIFFLSFFVEGNLGPIVGVVYGSIASLAIFILFLVAGILRSRGFTRKSAYSIAFAEICLIPFIYSVVAYTFNL
jgi:tetrahydromethanopterin S-methyltransferase subunit G